MYLEANSKAEAFGKELVSKVHHQRVRGQGTNLSL